MNSHTFSGFILAVVICAAVFAFARAQLAPANPHKAIDDYMRSYERLVEQVETLDEAGEQNFDRLVQNMEAFVATAERLQEKDVWTKNDSAMLRLLNGRYDSAVRRLVSGSLSRGIPVSFNSIQ